MLKSIIKKTALILSIFLVINACEEDDLNSPYTAGTNAVFNPDIIYGTMTDQDGNVYRTVTIGSQTWMAENLRTTNYNDGSPIPNVTENTEWTNLTTGAYCTYENTRNTDSIATFGMLYNWYAINTDKLAPKGWHVSADSEWMTLVDYLGGHWIAGDVLRETGTLHWFSADSGITNETGFTALPGGDRRIDGNFDFIGYCGHWGTSTEAYENYALDWAIYDATYDDVCTIPQGCSSKVRGLSVRCIKD